MNSYTVKQLATLSGVSVRTLHYYDEIGLLHPSRVRKNGYREYDKIELVRLQQILFFRELDFSLDEIQRIMNQPGFVIADALDQHKHMLNLKIKRLQKLIHTIDSTLTHMTTQQEINDEELYDAFKDPDVAQYQEEVKQRWGNTSAYAQSMARMSKMNQAEMAELKAKAKQFNQTLAEASTQYAIDSVEIQTLVAQHYAGIQFFYECSIDMYRQLGDMYVQDPRFRSTYDSLQPGLAQFLRDAIQYFCDHHETAGFSPSRKV